MILRARTFEFHFPRPVLVMGVVNVTPDSFSDGGKFLEPAAALAHAQALLEAGADILDIGGESTRPGAEAVSEQEELNRVLPVLKRLAGKVAIPISIDTTKPGVAQAALEEGASIINDVAANRQDDQMWRVTGPSGAGYVCMHMQGNPKTMQRRPQYEDVVREVDAFFLERMDRMSDCGMRLEQLILDPGIGFGKTPEHNLQLLAGLEVFCRHRRPVLVGVSRKSFLGQAGSSRLPAALACASRAAEAGANIIRTHDVAETVQAVRMTESILAKRQQTHVGQSL